MQALLTINTQSCFDQEFRLIPRLLRCLCQGVTLLQRITQVKLLDDIIADATATEILPADGDTIGIILHHVLEIVHRPVVDDEHRLTVALFLLLLLGEFLFLDLNIIFLRQPAQGLGIGDLFVLHQEVDGRTTLATSKALADLLRGGHHKRRGLIIVKRAQALVVHACLTQGHKLPHHVNDVRGVHDFIYRRSVNHFGDKVTKSRAQNKETCFFFCRDGVTSPS